MIPRSTVARRLVVSEQLSRLRAGCAEVAQRARWVRLNHGAIEAYAAELGRPGSPPKTQAPDPREQAAAYWITLDAINFGSGWFPTLRKPAGRSGYSTVASGLHERFTSHGPWSAQALKAITTAEIAHTLAQDENHELMGLFAQSLRDLGQHLADEHNGSFGALVASAQGSAAGLVETLSRWECFADLSVYEGLELPFLKRVQIAAADLHRAGVTRFADLGELTMFADNLVPHVLRLDGVLEFDTALVRRIEREELLEHGSPEEVEIRACALHAVELMVQARPEISAAEIDELLWNRGQGHTYKSRPRHRSRCTAY